MNTSVKTKHSKLFDLEAGGRLKKFLTAFCTIFVQIDFGEKGKYFVLSGFGGWSPPQSRRYKGRQGFGWPVGDHDHYYRDGNSR